MLAQVLYSGTNYSTTLCTTRGSLNAIHKSKIDKINTWTQFRNCKKKMLPFRCFLDLLSGRDSFGYNTFEEYYPGLCQKIDRLNVSPDKLVNIRISNVQAMNTKRTYIVFR